MTKYVCIKSLFGKIHNFYVQTQLLEEGSNFCIPEGKIVFILKSSDNIIDVYETEDYQKGFYFSEQPGKELEDYFMPFAEWREQQIKSILDD